MKINLDAYIPGYKSQPRIKQVMCMLKRTEDQEDPSAPLQTPVSNNKISAIIFIFVKENSISI